MKIIRPSSERGRSNFGWLDSHHSFSFGEYFDPQNMGWGPLRVINDDRVAGGGGFPTHPHRDMEIFSYVVEGHLAHKDTLGNKKTLAPGDIQLMSAGSGIMHSEFDPSDTDPAHFLQIWIEPSQKGLEPNYQELKIDPQEALNGWKLLMSPDEESDSLRIHQNVRVYAAKMSVGQSLELPKARFAKGYLHLVKGEILVDDQTLKTGDAIATENETLGKLEALKDAEILYFDLQS